MSDNIIKSITIQSCPHCNQDIYVESQTTPPSIESLFTKTQILEAKKDVREQIKELNISDDKKEDVIRWLNNEETIFGPNEVSNIVMSLLKEE